MTDRELNEFLRVELSQSREREAMLTDHIRGLEGSMAEMSANLKRQVESQKEAYAELLRRFDEQNAAFQRNEALLQAFRKHSEELEAANLNLKRRVDELTRKRFGRSSEQRALLNNRNTDVRAKESDSYDGSDDDREGTDNGGNGGSAATSSGSQAPSGKPSRHRRPTAGPDESEATGYDEVVEHPVDEYFVLPKGGRFIMKGGKVDTYCYETVEFIPGKMVLHRYLVAKYVDQDGDIHPTIESSHLFRRCPLDKGALAWILFMKYDLGLPKNRIRRELRHLGMRVGKSALGRMMSGGEKALREMLGDVLKEEVRQAAYLMGDETTELVGVVDQETGERCYRKKYLWGFYNKCKNLVVYIYEHGSRARQVVLDFLRDFCGYISTDGYSAYSVFGSGVYERIKRASCWTHARRLYVESLESNREDSMTMINKIGDVFGVEYEGILLKWDEHERLRQRRKRTRLILNDIWRLLELWSKDAARMANDLFRKAVNYMRNQWKGLEMILQSGLVEVSNNLMEQRFKPVKIDMKNCQNIGSEEEAENAAFMHSLFESCRLCGLDSRRYIESLLGYLGRDDIPDKKALLPCYFQGNC